MQKAFIVVALAVFSQTAYAHHPLGGLPMETFSHGLLSGIGHPLLGFDHLFFVLLVGIAAVFTRSGVFGPLAYIAAMLLGCLIVSISAALPAAEFMVALSLLVLGAMALSGRAFDPRLWLLTFAGFGLFHGAAFGSVLAAQESGSAMPVLGGYLLGLGVVQYALALASGYLCTAVWGARQATALQPRLAGAMVAGAGLLLVLEHLEGPLLAVISS